VGVTALMQSVGLSPALGAFLAGVVLGDSEYRREIETDIEPFRGLFLGLFFITIGAGMDLAAVAAQPLLIAALTVGLMSIKGLVLFALMRLFGAAGRDAGSVAVALSQGGEFAFVLFGFSVAAGVLPADVVAICTVAVALSMALTPLLMIAYARIPFGSVGETPEPEAEEFDESRPDAIVAGFGRFGQVVGRVLIANGYRTVVLESSAAQIELLRRFGRRVYYGDATRLDLLRAAGADGQAAGGGHRQRDKASTSSASRGRVPRLVVIARAGTGRHAYHCRPGAHGSSGDLRGRSRPRRRSSGWHARPRPPRGADLPPPRRQSMQELAPWGDEGATWSRSRESSRAWSRCCADLSRAVDDDALGRRSRSTGAARRGAEVPPSVARPRPTLTACDPTRFRAFCG
jgi:glutathione-regulated potassium-efflux system ancillary protein KefC/glutathione-regulated potassium-efflux system protein KefB